MNLLTPENGSPKCLVSPTVYLIYALFSFSFNFSACFLPMFSFLERQQGVMEIN